MDALNESVWQTTADATIGNETRTKRFYPTLKQRYFWGSGLWKDGYYVGTTGAVSEDVVRRYIEETEH